MFKWAENDRVIGLSGNYKYGIIIDKHLFSREEWSVTGKLGKGNRSLQTLTRAVQVCWKSHRWCIKGGGGRDRGIDENRFRIKRVQRLGIKLTECSFLSSHEMCALQKGKNRYGFKKVFRYHQVEEFQRGFTRYYPTQTPLHTHYQNSPLNIARKQGFVDMKR